MPVAGQDAPYILVAEKLIKSEDLSWRRQASCQARLGGLLQAGSIAGNVSLTRQHNMLGTEATVILAAAAEARACCHSLQVLLNFQRHARY